MYKIILDTETTNDIDCPFVYDFGFAVIDDDGKVYASYSFVVADVFCDDDLMASAYFADKIQSYWDDIRNGSRVLKSFRNIEKVFRRVCHDWNVNTFIAHNARFDYLSLNTTKRYLTCSKYRFFFPYQSRFIDTLKLSRKVFGDDADYRAFCIDNDYLTKAKQNRYTAEVLYRYMMNDNSFVEAHTGLSDCLIEKEIYRYCVSKTSIESGYLFD